MIALIVFLIGLFVILGTGILAGISDFKGLTIPNIYSVVIIGAFFATYGLLWLFGREDVFFSLSSHLLSALIIFGVTAAMFAFKTIGAADSKLATAYALWVGLVGLPAFLFYMTVAGAFLGLIAIISRKWKPWKSPPEGSWLEQVQAGENKVPYGIAIVIGALASFVNLGYFGGDVLSSFVLS